MSMVILGSLPACQKVSEELSHLRKDIDLRLQGGPVASLIFDHEFQLSVWHQNPGTISNGHLLISVSGKGLKGEPNAGHNLDEWSFDYWQPNEASAKHVRYYVDTVGNDLDLQIRIRITSGETAPYDKTFFFKDGKWSKAHDTWAVNKFVNAKKKS